MNAGRQIGRREPERGGNVEGGAAAEAVATARKSLVVPMLMLRSGLALVVSMFLGARIVVSGVQMKRGMSVAAGESERQDHDQATQQAGIASRREHVPPKNRKPSNPA